MKLNLDQLEAKIQSLVESQLAGLLPGLTPQDKLIQKLAVVLKQNILEQKDKDIAFAPNVYTLVVAPESAHLWNDTRIIETLTKIITSAGKDVGLKFETTPTITITIGENFSPGDTSIVASHKLQPVEETQGMATKSNEPESNEMIPDNAFLIIEGVKVHQLKESVVNIGRRLENHVVIDDPRISRNHAQLRAIKGRYVLFDLNSTGGTFVNGQRTSQTVLYPGDVISLAGVALIFGQDNPPPRLDLNETSPLNPDPEANNRPTATLDNKTVDIRTGSLSDLENKKPDKT